MKESVFGDPGELRSIDLTMENGEHIFIRYEFTKGEHYVLFNWRAPKSEQHRHQEMRIPLHLAERFSATLSMFVRGLKKEFKEQLPE